MPDNWVEALFNRSLDVFAKIVPGLILLGALLVSLKKSWGCAYSLMAGLPWGAWVAVLAAAWVAGFAVQAVGEVFRLIRYFPPKIDDPPKGFTHLPIEITESQWFEMMAEFRRRSGYDKHRAGYYRLGLIKEACGNSYVALSLVALWIAFWQFIIFIFKHPACDSVMCNILSLADAKALLFVVPMILLLRKMHFIHVDRQYNYLKSVLDSPDS